MDLEVQVAADSPGVAGLADVADDLADVHQVALLEGRRMDHVRVPVLPPLAQPPNDDVVAVEAWVIGPLHDRARGCGSEGRLASGGDIAALVDTSAVTRSSELPHRPAGPVRAAHREEVAVELGRAGLLLATASDSDDDAIGAVGDR